ncbi:hypothetical protein PVAG01_08319 [Phlyctema vagabunda]|uniref:Uncharacterized protein n=1 Tax=Phlyctema vagabunda TaxID=108571 RepID=A0ABR4P932_9HELO
MSSSSSAATSTLSRSRAVVLLVTTVAAAYGVYYLQTSIFNDSATSSTPSLHRSNAVHRRRRRAPAANDEDGPAELPAVTDDSIDIIARALTDGDTVVDEQAYQDEYNWQEVPAGYQRSGQNIVQLLFRVSEDATKRNSYVHRGCACNSCGILPIRGVRYRCSNCADFDLCESCEAQGLHTKTHIFYKVKIPAPSFGPKNTQPVWYPGDPDGCQRALPKEIITKLSSETGFERPELDAYWEQWTYMANTEWREDPDEVCLAMDRKTFERCLVPSAGGSRYTAPSLIYDRMFAFYDSNKDNLIGFSEFLHGLAFRKKRDKWAKIFDGYDIDGDGYVDRRDFLRLFRAYYVMYRQMHREMLDGYDDQVMNSTDAQQLVSGRQPLSGAFGRDGRFPAAPNPHTGVGKARQPNGDWEIEDGRGVINENTHDTGNREDVFIRPLPRSEHHGRRPLGRNRAALNDARASRAYAEAMLNPPETVEQLTRTILDGLAQGNGFETMDDLIDSRYAPAPERETDDSTDEDEESRIRPEDDRRWPPSYVTNAVVEEVLGPGFTLSAQILRRPDIRQAIIAHALAKRMARRDVHERWVRRQFYTDEEEGATAPSDWDESEDILVNNGLVGAGESSKAQSQSRPISPRSRSSSKVRFVEDTDDYDIRSNPSTSSRSIPERWGGMEIADAEKDAGKEILYQVTQQAYNELLDPIFKRSEDLATAIAEAKTEREKYRHLWDNPEFDKWAIAQEKSQKPRDRGAKANFIAKITKDVTENQSHMWPGFPRLPEGDIEVDGLRQRPLDELLSSSGYSVAQPNNVDHDDNIDDAMPELEVIPLPSLLNPEREAEASRRNDTDIVENTQVAEPSDALPNAAESSASVPVAEVSSTDTEYRDPTMPQFRPNSLAPSLVPTPMAPPVSEPEPDQRRLLSFWKQEQAVREAERRGGFGKLNFEEFESQIKGCVKAGKGNSMEYLGSWIDFCIP